MNTTRRSRVVAGAGVIALGLTAAVVYSERGEVLWSASCAGRTTVVRLLLALGVDANGADSPLGANEYPLLCAAGEGRTEVVRLLLAAGANPNLSCCGATPLGQAAYGGHLGVARALLAAGAMPGEGWPLGMAARRGDRELVLLLLEAGADASEKDDYGRDTIEVARSAGHGDVARLIAGFGR